MHASTQLSIKFGYCLTTGGDLNPHLPLVVMLPAYAFNEDQTQVDATLTFAKELCL